MCKCVLVLLLLLLPLLLLLRAPGASSPWRSIAPMLAMMAVLPTTTAVSSMNTQSAGRTTQTLIRYHEPVDLVQDE
jgi:hypothetical protein